MANTELEQTHHEQAPTQAVDPAEEPSVEWGWHGSFPKGIQIAGWFSTFAMVMMLIGNHQGILSGGGHFISADIWLIAIAAVMAVALLYDLRRRRTSWRR
ncbi:MULTISPECIES: DUF2631 domain-containing protein [Actinopolyspora]|uniref:DUF2631 domain-containing protein n=1 Tax=Actinopolyspora saharensis TaxID=995062 RepID=A0A1H1D0Q5_9ACTN|nr:DUF2631 domain-containing protein [Actinopolyspora saharensis]NHD17230.1 DUF2631 domain-containing protein [Actinopolyspora sp. BKK2]NHE76382.1 DUF2631 domain-containing protein [Actinopolyspora sp. BKK1]SDQ70053.1 Protein of unknown function [Actinopolyspora saharensis]